MSSKPVRTVGVLGGMGPEATVDFMTRVIALTPAEKDQDHVRMLVENNPQVPDRQEAMRGDDSAVRQSLSDMAVHLAGGGADFLVMPCNTAHAFVQDAIDAVSIPFISIVDVTIQAVVEALPSARSVGLLATDACIQSGVYQQAVDATALTLVLPDAEHQRLCMDAIFSVKRGDAGEEVRRCIRAVAESVIADGAEAVIAGCTEIPLILTDDDISVPLISSTEMLARRTVELATGARPLPPRKK